MIIKIFVYFGLEFGIFLESSKAQKRIFRYYDTKVLTP